MSGRDPSAAARSHHRQFPASTVQEDNPPGRPLCPDTAATPLFRMLASRRGREGGGRDSGARTGWGSATGEEDVEEEGGLWSVGVESEGRGRTAACHHRNTGRARAFRFICPSSLAGGSGTFLFFLAGKLPPWNQMTSRARHVRMFVPSFVWPSVRAMLPW